MQDDQRALERRAQALLIGFAVVSVASVAVAQELPVGKPGNPDTVIEMTRSAAKAWRQSMISQGRGLFWGLATIEAAYRWGKQAFSGEVKSLVPAIWETLLRVGFWCFVLEQSDAIVPTIIQSLHQAGVNAATAASGGASVTPQALYDAAVKLMMTAWAEYSGLELLNHANVLFGTVLVFVSYGLCAAFIWLCHLRAHVVAGGGAIMLAFGGSTWTMQYAQGYLRALVACGVNLLVLELIKGATLPTMQAWLVYSSKGQLQVQDALEMALSAIALPVFVISGPGIVSSIVTGSAPGHHAEMIALASTTKALTAAGGALGGAAGKLAAAAVTLSKQGAKFAMSTGSSDARSAPPSPASGSAGAPPVGGGSSPDAPKGPGGPPQSPQTPPPSAGPPPAHQAPSSTSSGKPNGTQTNGAPPKSADGAQQAADGGNGDGRGTRASNDRTNVDAQQRTAADPKRAGGGSADASSRGGGNGSGQGNERGRQDGPSTPERSAEPRTTKPTTSSRKDPGVKDA